MNTKEIDLGSVQETLLLPLWGRAVETQKSKPLLIDHLAVSIVKSLNYDFSIMANNISALTCLSWIARSIYFDQEIKTFLATYPEGTIINVGCGLDTTYDRVDNGRSVWYELDLPDVIALRRKYIKERARRTFIAESVLNAGWYSQIKNKEHVLLLLAGVIYYFDETSVKRLFYEFSKQFKTTTVLFDYSSKKGVEIANKKVIQKGGMSTKANLVWGLDNIYELEKWDGNIRVINNMPMFKEHKKNYPVLKRIGMSISDFLKVMSLTHIEISGI
jgi:O-methyltransferase involved in polyketide biosynthesis